MSVMMMRRKLMKDKRWTVKGMKRLNLFFVSVSFNCYVKLFTFNCCENGQLFESIEHKKMRFTLFS